MRLILALSLIAPPAFATAIDGAKLERLLGLEHVEGPERPVVVVPSPLPWRLLGTLRSRDGSSFAAMECSLKSVTMQVGDIRDGVEIISIEQQLAIVRRAGRLERVGAKAGVPMAILPPGKMLPRTVVDQFMANPEAVFKEVQLMPAMVDGRLTGFRARWVKEGSLVAKLGLKTGDTIIKVNGMPLDSMGRAFSLLQVLATTRRFDVELERDGQRIVESVELN